MKTYHVLTIKIAVEQLDPADAHHVRGVSRQAIEGALAMLSVVTGRHAECKAVVLEPLQLLERSEGETDER